jgi:hypothetical protein
MITYDRMLCILDDWIKWMRRDNDQLGYPKKSLMFSTGGSVNSEAFDDMCDAVDEKNCEIMNSIINDLDRGEREAIFYRLFKQQPKPFYYELKLTLAYTNILKKLEEKNVI